MGKRDSCVRWLIHGPIPIVIEDRDRRQDLPRVSGAVHDSSEVPGDAAPLRLHGLGSIPRIAGPAIGCNGRAIHT